MTLSFEKFNKVLEVVEVHVRTKFHQAECSVHELSCPQAFLPSLATVKNLIIRCCDNSDIEL